MGVRGSGAERSLLRGQEECCSLQGWQPGWRGCPGHFVSFRKFLSPTSPLRVLTVLQVPRVWLVRGASLVFLGSVAREDSLAYPAHR